MLISLAEAFDYAERTNSGLAAVNTPFFEALLATIDVGEETNTPIILQFAQVHEGIVSINDIGPAMVELAKRSPAPFVLHLDHCADIDYISNGLDLGFNSCMIDASQQYYEDNLRLTSEVVALAKPRGIGVEAELGVMTGNENGDPDQGIADEALYTDPKLAAEFVHATGVDCLAASFGTVHGIYRQKPKLDYELITQLRQQTGVPIVMHGGSGLSEAEYQASISHGVRKINYYTYAAKAGYDAAAEVMADEKVILFSNLAKAAREGVKRDVSHFVSVLSNTSAQG